MLSWVVCGKRATTPATAAQCQSFGKASDMVKERENRSSSSHSFNEQGIDVGMNKIGQMLGHVNRWH